MKDSWPFITKILCYSLRSVSWSVKFNIFITCCRHIGHGRCILSNIWKVISSASNQVCWELWWAPRLEHSRPPLITPFSILNSNLHFLPSPHTSSLFENPPNSTPKYGGARSKNLHYSRLPDIYWSCRTILTALPSNKWNIIFWI